MANFQAPDNRKFVPDDPNLSPWPARPDSYRFYVDGPGGEEKIGVQTGRKIKMQLIGARAYKIQTTEDVKINRLLQKDGVNVTAAAASVPRFMRASSVVAESDREDFFVSAQAPGATVLQAIDATQLAMARLTVVVGSFANHAHMKVDLIAEVCKRDDTLKLLALQRMLNNRWNGSAFTADDNLFSQQSPANVSPDPKIGGMTCGIVAKQRAREVFDAIQEAPFDWYQAGAIHEPLSNQISDRKQVKYRSQRVEALRSLILKSLSEGRAVRVGVLDNPVLARMRPVNGKLVAYFSGGHTLLIVGCSEDGKEFLYIDPWSGGSQMEYLGGFGAGFFAPGKCQQIGKLIVKHDPDRKASRTDTGNNVICMHPDTQGTFKYSDGSFLEVVSAPFRIGG